MEDAGRKEVATDGVTETQKDGVLSFEGDSWEAVVRDLRTGAAHFANAGHNVMADVMRAVAKRVERLQLHGNAPARQVRDALVLPDVPEPASPRPWSVGTRDFFGGYQGYDFGCVHMEEIAIVDAEHNTVLCIKGPREWAEKNAAFILKAINEHGGDHADA